MTYVKACCPPLQLKFVIVELYGLQTLVDTTCVRPCRTEVIFICFPGGHCMVPGVAPGPPASQTVTVGEKEAYCYLCH